MEELVRLPRPRIVANYQFGEWTITVIETKGTGDYERTHEFYLSALGITDFMFGLPENSYTSFEDMIMNNLKDYIKLFKDKYDTCNEIENPFDEE